MKRVLLILVFICSGLQPATGQVYPFRTYSIEKGLSEAVVHDLMQDENGYLWIATGYGLNRFDAHEFKNYYKEDGLQSNKIYSLYLDDENRIWIGTDSGVNILQSDSIKTLPVLKPLSSFTVSAIFQGHFGEYWFATDGQGIWHLNGRNFLQQYTAIHGLANNHVRAIVEDSTGALWFGTADGLTRLHFGNFRTFTTADGLAGNNIQDLAIDKKGVLWVATASGLSRYRNGSFTNYTERDGLISNRIHSISPDGKGGLWIGTEEGASHFQNGTFANYSVKEGLVNNIIYATMRGRENNIWFGTFGGGISLFLGKQFSNYTTDTGLPDNMITSIAEDREGNHWVGTYGGGIAKMTDSGIKNINTEDGLIDDKVYSLTFDSRGRLLIGTHAGFSILQNGTFHNYSKTEIPFQKVRGIEEVESKNLYWLATYGSGVVRFKDGKFTVYDEEDGLAGNTVLALEEGPEGAMWFATYSGVSRYKNGEFSNFTIEDGLPHNGILDIAVAKSGAVWFSTFGGIVKFENGKITSITVEDGLPDEVGYFIIEGKPGILWIGTNEGVVRFDTRKYKQAESESVQHAAFKLFTDKQGLVSNEMNAGAVLKDSNGVLWFGSVNGLSRFKPRFFSDSPVAPTVNIESVETSGMTVNEKNGLEIPSGERNITIEFVGIDFSAPQQMTYKYRLKNSGEDWQFTNQRRVRYSSLLPGNYQFVVKARNSSGLWSEEAATLSFTVLAPYWLKWWFITVCILVILGFIAFVYNYYRVKKMVEIERMRVRIASDLHDDVGSSLTEIALQSDFLQTTNAPDALKDSVKQIGEQSRKIVSGLDDIVWSIDARNDTIGDLTDRMQDYVNTVLSDRKVIYHFNGIDMDEKLTVQRKENLYLIFKEAVNNIAKHSNATKVTVKIETQENAFELLVHDNGTKIDKSRKSGQGLHNMNMRAERMDASVIFKNKDGFTVHVKSNSSR